MFSFKYKWKVGTYYNENNCDYNQILVHIRNHGNLEMNALIHFSTNIFANLVLNMYFN